jgi:adenylylsulfate kinase
MPEINSNRPEMQIPYFYHMLILQFTGLSGAGKTTIAQRAKAVLAAGGLQAEIIDGDVYRQTICKDLGFSREDRCENIRRLGAAAASFAGSRDVAIIAAINPYESARQELKERYNAKTIWIRCAMELLLQRDTKGLYARAMLPDNHPDKIANLTGVNDVYETPLNADLIINTDTSDPATCVQQLVQYVYGEMGGGEVR